MLKRLKTFPSIKYLLGLAVVLGLRLLPWRAPNVEPILAAGMPFAKRYSALSGFCFGLASILAFDLLTGTGGIWTLVTGLSYGLVIAGSAWYLKRRASRSRAYMEYAVIGTVAYDALTGLTIGPLVFHQSLAAAFFGQIPFTALHLLGNIAFAALLSPAIYRFIVTNPKLEFAWNSAPLGPQVEAK